MNHSTIDSPPPFANDDVPLADRTEEARILQPVSDLFGNWPEPTPPFTKRPGYVSLGFCGFKTNPFPRGNGSNLGRIIPDPTLRPANDNAHAERWPIREEYIAGRLGATQIENDAAWDAALYVAEVWVGFGQEEHPIAGGHWHKSGGGKTRIANMSVLHGPERTVHFNRLWRDLDKRTNGRFQIVKRAVVDACEMHQLALDIPNRKKRAAIGRQRLIEALPIVAEEVRLLDVADAA